MSEYRIDFKVRNNLILKKIEALGYKSVNSFCIENNLQPRLVGELLAMKVSPLRNNGEFTILVKRLSKIFKCEEKDLFTETQLNAILKTNKRTILVEEAQAKFYLENHPPQKFLEEQVLDDQIKNELNKQLEYLTEREKDILCMRNGLNGYEESTLEVCGEKYQLATQTIRQIEAKALRKMRYPDRAKLLYEIAEDY